MGQSKDEMGQTTASKAIQQAQNVKKKQKQKNKQKKKNKKKNVDSTLIQRSRRWIAS